MKRLFISGFIMFMLLCLYGCDKKQPEQPKAIVETKLIQEEQIADFSETKGRVVAEYTDKVVARIDGYLQKSFFKEGSMVKKGDLLFQIEPYTYAAKVNEASANLRNAQAALVDSSKNLHRAEQLVKEDFISKSDYDGQLALRDKDRANVDSTRATLAQAKINYGYTKIYAPVTGKISRIYITEGNYVTPSSGTIASVVSMDPMLVFFGIKSRMYLALQKAAKTNNLSDIKIEITLADDTVYKHRGTIKFIDNMIDESSGTVQVCSSFANPDNLLVPGDYVSVKMTLDDAKKVIMVPQEAVLESPDGKYVYLIDENKIAKQQFIEVGTEYDGNWIIKNGVKAGDNVAIKGVQHIIPDKEVILASEYKAQQEELMNKKNNSFWAKLKRKIKNIFGFKVEVSQKAEK